MPVWGQLHCKSCGPAGRTRITGERLEFFKEKPAGTQLIITFPYRLEAAAAEEVRKILMQTGFDRLYLNGQIAHLDEWQPRNKEKEIPVLVDRVLLQSKDRERILDSLELAYRFGGGRLDVWVPPHNRYAFAIKHWPAQIAASNTIRRCRIFFRLTALWVPVIPAGDSGALSGLIWI